LGRSFGVLLACLVGCVRWSVAGLLVGWVELSVHQSGSLLFGGWMFWALAGWWIGWLFHLLVGQWVNWFLVRLLGGTVGRYNDRLVGR
jgi:hypothetical protein